MLKLPDGAPLVATYDSIDELALTEAAGEWDEVVAASRPAGAAFCSRGFLAAIEEAYESELKFLHAIVYDEGRPAACASFCTYPIDPVLLSDGAMKRVAQAIGKVAPFVRTQKIIMGGPPASVGASHLAMVPGAHRERIIKALHETAVAFARREGANFIAFKELTGAESRQFGGAAGLEAHGYRRYPSFPTHRFERTFESFDDYCKALRSRHRYGVRKSIKKAKQAGLRHERITDPEEMIRIYTPQLHKLYEAVALSAKNRLEVLPIDFFHGLARRMPGEAGITVMRHGERVVGFCWHLNDGRAHHSLFAGVDYDANPEWDLYFNLLYAEMDYAFQSGAKEFSFGQAAESFKARLGCVQEPLWFYLTPRGPFGSLMLKLFSGLMFPKPPPPPEFHVFSLEE
jgi:hypothetical protein